MLSKTTLRFGCAGAILASALISQSALADHDDNRGESRRQGFVYTLNNSAADNGLVVMRRAADGSLGSGITISTGGLGTGSGLGNQGGLVMSDDDRFAYAVNAGSDEISAFSTRGLTPDLRQVISSGGHRPISIAIHDDLLYVLNAGGGDGATDNISGFHIQRDGTLCAINNSTQPLSADSTGPAQIGFSSDGRVLIVTEKSTNKIDTFVVDRHGRAQAGVAHDSAGMTPFGFSVDSRGHLLVTEAFGGTPGISTVSSYDIGRHGELTVIDGVVPTQQTAACWAASTDNSRFVYATNTGSNSVTGFSVDHAGNLTPLSDDGRTAETAATPIDVAVVGNRFLYVLTSTAHQVQGYRIANDGSLQPLNFAGGLPAGDIGLIAR